MEKIGTVARLRRYPVKSMRGEDLDSVTVESYGFVGDRIYAYVIDDAPNPRFPWMSARQAAEMLLYKPSFRRAGEIEIQTPYGEKYSVRDVALENTLEERYGYGVFLKHRESGCHDSKPVSILGIQTVKRLEEETGIGELEPERFRANIYADWETGEPFLEDRLIGSRLQIGENVMLKVVKKDSRCVIPTLDPRTGIASPGILEKIRSNHAGTFGVYAEVLSIGRINKGDVINLD